MIDSQDLLVNNSPEADQRLLAARAWLSHLPIAAKLNLNSLRPASSDASFRRYFRLDLKPTVDESGIASYIVMDAPPDREDCRPFVRIAELLRARGVHTPQLLAQDLDQGFLLLSDLGNTTFSDAIGPAAAAGPVLPSPSLTGLYHQALSTLVQLQRPAAIEPFRTEDLPVYDDARLQTEMRLFPDWYIAKHKQTSLSAAEAKALQGVFDRLSAAARTQAQVLVHRDYHCRNLMVLPDGTPGVLDFQDAVMGPITYDLVSLLRDAYVTWPEDLQIDWAARYWDQARRAGLPVPERFDAFWQDLEWMGLQRSLKVLGIFARLAYRDGKDRYLADLPRVLRHTLAVAERYDVFSSLAKLLYRLDNRDPQVGYTF